MNLTVLADWGGPRDQGLSDEWVPDADTIKNCSKKWVV